MPPRGQSAAEGTPHITIPTATPTPEPPGNELQLATPLTCAGGRPRAEPRRGRERGPTFAPQRMPAAPQRMPAAASLGPKGQWDKRGRVARGRPFPCTGAAPTAVWAQTPRTGTQVASPFVFPSSEQLEKQVPTRGAEPTASGFAGDGVAQACPPGRMAGAPFIQERPRCSLRGPWAEGRGPGRPEAHLLRLVLSSGPWLGFRIKEPRGSPGKTLPGDTRCLKATLHHNDTPRLFSARGFRTGRVGESNPEDEEQCQDQAPRLPRNRLPGHGWEPRSWRPGVSELTGNG